MILQICQRLDAEQASMRAVIQLLKVSVSYTCDYIMLINNCYYFVNLIIFWYRIH